jgi:hypothetical protein
MPTFAALAVATALTALAFLAGCGQIVHEKRPATSRDPSVAPLPAPRGEAARAENAVRALSGALRDGDVERLCRPNAVFTAAVVAENNASGRSCEAALELSSLVRRPPSLTVVGLAWRPDLATAQVRVGRDRTVPLDLVRDGSRWLVSFSDGVNPLAALA